MLSTQERLDRILREIDFVRNYEKKFHTMDLTEFIYDCFTNVTVIDIPDEMNKKILLKNNERYLMDNMKKLFYKLASITPYTYTINSYLEGVNKQEVSLTYEDCAYETPDHKYRYLSMCFTLPDSKNKYESLIIDHLGGNHVYIETPHEFLIFNQSYNHIFDYEDIDFCIDTKNDKIEYLNYYIIERIEAN